MLFHSLVIVIESTDGAAPWNALRTTNNDAFASAPAWCSNYHFLLAIGDEFFVCICSRFYYTTSAPLYLLALVESDQWYCLTFRCF